MSKAKDYKHIENWARKLEYKAKQIKMQAHTLHELGEVGVWNTAASLYDNVLLAQHSVEVVKAEAEK